MTVKSQKWKSRARFASLGFLLWNLVLLGARWGDLARWRGMVAAMAFVAAVAWFVAAWRWRVAVDRQDLSFGRWLSNCSADMVDVWRR